MRPLPLAAPLLWTVLIAWFSTDTWSGEQTASVLLPWLRTLLSGVGPELLDRAHWLVRKLAHVIAYGVLAALWAGALAGWSRRAWWAWALGLSLATAILDELHQTTTAARGGSLADVVLDGLGIVIALALLRGAVQPALGTLTGLVLWAAAGGGSALLAVAVVAEVPGGWLWLTTPAAWLVLWRRWRRGAAPRRPTPREGDPARRGVPSDGGLRP